MIDQMTPKGRIVAAALRLAAEHPWDKVTLLDIAEAAGTTLAGLKAEKLTGKSAILAAFSRMIDDDVLVRAKKPASGGTPRDALFDVVMARFDALLPFRPALRSIAKAGSADSALVRSLLTSQAWMLQAAGISADGPKGAIKAAGLGTVYASVFRTWLDDEDAGLARTMAALDRRLRRGEGTMQTLRDIESTLCRVACMFMPGGRKRKPEPVTPAAAPPASEAPMPS